MKRRFRPNALGPQEDDLSEEEIVLLVDQHGVDGKYLRKPTTRGECSPPADTVECPICEKAPGDPCFHPERIEAARAHLRPCPWVSCRHHLYLNVMVDGGIFFNFPAGTDPMELAHTCTLDEAERGGLDLDEIGTRLRLTRERIRQIADQAIATLAGSFEDPEKLMQQLDLRSRLAGIVFSPSSPHRGEREIGRCPTCGAQRRRKRNRKNRKWTCRCRKDGSD